MAIDYKKTLNLPRSDFPMKANLAQKEPGMLETWEKINIYKLLRMKCEGRPSFILHDGPPYANGHIHIGTAFNKILKDIIVKVKGLEGYDAVYVPGWDCHGLPIELQVDRELGQKKAEMSIGDFRRRCRSYAARFIDIQRDEFRRLGVFGDWWDPYLTMNYKYQAVIVRELAKFFSSGTIYQGFKPVYWCISCKTALAEAEVEYQERVSPSIYVRFPLVSDPEGILPEKYRRSLSALIWTTTPWTIPANLAISVHPDFDYSIIETDRGDMLVATALIDEVAGENNLKVNRIGDRIPGSRLESLVFRHPFAERDVVVLVGDHVTSTSGTGLVHTAPGHGQEDYDIGTRYGLSVYSPVDADGRFTKEVPQFEGEVVFDANQGVVDLLEKEDKLLGSGRITHSYPHCWRCKTPVIFRATRQWFISMDQTGLRRNSLDEIKRVQWIPSWGEDRIYNMIENRPDWCISRQRFWGSPLSVFYCSSCRELLATPEIFEHVASLFEKDGADAWFDRKAEELIPPGTRCPSCGGGKFEKENDILDVWFDSGVSHAAVVEKRDDLVWPADMYLEGSDQHRGWFHSALLTSVGTRGKAPYRTVLTHGFVVDADGKKMSKSAGNVIAPQEIIDRYGAEILRMWVSAEDYTHDIRISMEILQRLVEAYRRIRNTARFILGNLHDFEPDRDMVSAENMEELDLWILSKLDELSSVVRSAYNEYQFHLAFNSIHQFCSVEMSSLYLDIVKDRLYISQASSPRRRSAQSAIFIILRSLVKMISPVMSFTAEEIWSYLPSFSGKEESIFLALWDELPDYILARELQSKWETFFEVRKKVTRALEKSRQSGVIGHPLDASVTLHAKDGIYGVISGKEDQLKEIFIVSEVKVEPSSGGAASESEDESLPGLDVKVSKARGEKCQRCWNYNENIGQTDEYPGICPRCTSIMKQSRT